MKKQIYFLLIISIFINKAIIAQVKVQYDKVKSHLVVEPRNITNDWLFEIQNIDNIEEGNVVYKQYFAEQKKIVNAKYASKSIVDYVGNDLHKNNIDTPYVDYAFEGNKYSSGVPNDNTMAVSNGGMVVSAINTNIIFYDTNNDSLLKKISLRAFSAPLTGISTHQYDPKAIYDYQNDKFILVYLAGSGTSGSSHVIVAFSTTNNPMDAWNLYALEGNPFNDNSWTDYPAISLSDKELFITGNLIKTGNGSWQTSFKQSLIWQIDKHKGFGAKELDFAIYSDIKHKGINCRNIHPVRGGNKFYGPEMYFMSERNFDIENDTFFLMKIDKYLDKGNLNLSVDAVISDEKYGMPPNAKQPLVGKDLATNDSRVLGAFFHDNKIQFVGNSVDFITGHASFYHGTLNPNNIANGIHLNVFSDSLMEYGYPNISFCGSTAESQQSIITYNFTSKRTKPGMGSFIFKGNDDTYSKPSVLKAGESNIRVLVNTQRWGDYSASQPKYNKVGQVWASGTYAKYYYSKPAYGTWIASLNTKIVDEVDVPEGKKLVSKVFPNPVVDQRATIEFTLAESETILIQIVDLQGKIIADLYNQTANRGRNLISFNTISMENGVYFVLIKDGENIIESKKIIVMNE